MVTMSTMCRQFAFPNSGLPFSPSSFLMLPAYLKITGYSSRSQTLLRKPAPETSTSPPIPISTEHRCAAQGLLQGRKAEAAGG